MKKLAFVLSSKYFTNKRVLFIKHLLWYWLSLLSFLKTTPAKDKEQIRYRRMLAPVCGLILMTSNLTAQSISVTNVTPTSICAGSSVTLTFSATNGGGSKFTNSTIYTIYLSNSSGGGFASIGTFSTSGVNYATGGSATTNNITQLVTIPSTTTPSGTGYKISLGSNSPLVDGSTGTNASSAFTIKALPTSVMSGTASICNGSSTTISIALTGTQPWSLTYTDGTTPTSVAGITTSPYTFNVSPSSSKTYSVTALSDANCTGTSITGSTIITVNSRSTSAILSGTATICSGSSTTLSVAITGGTSPYTVVYNDGTSNFTVNSYSSGSNITVSPSSTKTYSLVSITNANGCSGTGLSGIATVTVNPRPTPTFTSPSGTSTCVNTDVIYTTQSGQSNYVWSVPGVLNTDYTITSGGTGATSNTVTLKWLTSGNKTVTVNYTDANGCTGASAASSTVTVYVPNNVSNGFTGNTICSTGTGQLTFDVNNSSWFNASAAGSIQYTDGTTTWTQSIPSADPYPFNVSVNPSVTTTYTLVSVTNDLGCTTTTGFTDNTAQIAISTPPNNVSGGFTGSTICSGSNGTLTFDALNSTWSNANNPGSIQYTNGTTTWSQTIPNANANTFNVAVNPTVTTTYTLVSITNDVGCVSTSGFASSSAQIFVNARPVPSFTASPASGVCSATDVTYTTQSGQTNYIWSGLGTLGTDYTITSGGIGTGSNTVTLKWLTTGSKTVTVNYTDANGCTGASAASSTITVNVTPTITLTSSAISVCYGTTSTSLAYSATSGTPSQYSITWNTTPTNTLVAITNATLPASPITISIPANHSGGTFTGNLTVRNSTTGCVSVSVPFTLTINNDVTGLTAMASAAQCSNSGISVTLSSSRLASGSYTVTYQFNGGGSTNSTTVSFVSGSSGSGTFTTVTPATSDTYVTIKSVTLGGCSTTGLNINSNTFTVSAPPDATSTNLSTSASGTDIGNLLGSTITIISTKLTAGTYTVGYTVTDAATNTIVYINNTQSITFATSTRRNRLQGSFTTGQLNTANSYRVNINYITSPSTGCIANISGEFATFSVVDAIYTVGSGLWDGVGVWSSNGAGPDYRSGPITINHQVTYDATAISILLELDQLTIGPTGHLMIASGQEFRLKDGNLVDITVQSGGKLTIGSTTIAAGDPYNGTLVFENGVTHTGTSSTAVTFQPNSLYQHLFTTTEGIPPLATWAATSTCSIEGYTNTAITFSSTNWSQNFGDFVWNCASQTTQNGDDGINLNGLLGVLSLGVRSIQGNLTINSTGTGIVRLGNTTDYSLTIPGNISINGSSRFSTGPDTGNGPVIVLNLSKFIYGSTASSWLCEAGQATVNVTGNIQVNSGIIYLSDGGGNINRSGASVHISGNLAVASGASLLASSSNSQRTGALYFDNLPFNSDKTHTYTINTGGTIGGYMRYQIAANQTVRAVDESAFISTATAAGSFTVASGATLVVESTATNGAIQSVTAIPTTASGNLLVLNAARTFTSGATIEYGRTFTAASQYISSGHPLTSGVNCTINNANGVTVSSPPTSSTVNIGGNLTVQNGTLTVTENNLTIEGTLQTLNSSNVIINTKTLSAGATALTVNGAINMQGGGIQFNSSPSVNASNTELNINGDLQGTNFFTFSGANCQVTVGGGTRTFSRDFPINTATSLEYLTMNSAGTTLVVPQALTLGNISTDIGGLVLTNGNVDMNADLLVTSDAKLTNGILYFEGVNMELQRNITSGGTGISSSRGLFSSNSSSKMSITSSFQGTPADSIGFVNNNILGSLIINRTHDFPSQANAQLLTPVTISNVLHLKDGQFYAPSGLSMGSGATIIRTPQAEFYTGSTVPTGGPYHVTYNNYIQGTDGNSTTATSLTNGIELQGSLNNVTSNLSGIATIANSLTGIGTLSVNNGVFDCVTYAVAMNAVSVASSATLTAPIDNVITLTGDFTNSGTFNSGSGNSSVIFNGISTISGSSITQFNFLTLNDNKMLTAPSVILLKRDLVLGSGSAFNHNKGNIEFNGTVDQSITANNTLTGTQDLSMDEAKAQGTMHFYKLTVNKSGGVLNLLTPLKLGHMLDIKSASTIHTNDNLVLLSQNKSTALDASIGAIPTGAVVNGKVEVQRFMGSTAYALFRYISSPVPDGAIPSAYVNKLYSYDPSGVGYNTGTWVRNYSTMTTGVGYAALSYSPGDARWSVKNNIHQGPFQWNALEYGWNLIGNPYPSAVRWEDDVTDWNLSNVSTTIAITDNNVSGYPNYFRYLNYDGKDWGTGEIAGNVIAMGQSFWVYAGTGGGSLMVNESAKVYEGHASGQFYRKGDTPVRQLMITINNGQFMDHTFFHLDKQHNNALARLEANLPKLWNPSMNVYLINHQQQELLTYTLKDIQEEMKIPVGIKVDKPGEYEISFTISDTFGYSIYLIDRFEGEALPITKGQRYKIQIKDVSQLINDRFYLSLTPEVAINKETLVSFYPNPVTNHLTVEIMGKKGISQITITDMSGKVLRSVVIKREAYIDVSDFTNGFYILKVQTEKGIFVQKFLKHD